MKKKEIKVYLHWNPQFPAVSNCIPVFLFETLLIAFKSLALKNFIEEEVNIDEDRRKEKLI